MTSEPEEVGPGGDAPAEGTPPPSPAAEGSGIPGTDAAAEADGVEGVTEDLDERRLHPAWVLSRTLLILRGSIPAAIGLAVGLREYAIPAVVVLALLIAGFQVLAWRVTRYTVVDGTLRLRSGILARRERVVPASRISALDTSRGLVQRLFGLVALEVQTAGGGKQSELKLDAITYEEAERLRAALGHGHHDGDGVFPGASVGATPGGPSAADAPTDAGVTEGPRTSDTHPPGRVEGPAGPTTGVPRATADAAAPARATPGRAAEPPAAPVYAITGRQIVIAALTGPQLGLVVALVASLFTQVGDVLPDSVTDRVGDELTGADVTTIVVFVVLAVLLAGVVSVVGTVLAFAEFTVLRDDRRLRVRRGLLTERTGTIPLDRIHGLRIVEGPLRRPLGYATVQVEVAGYRGDAELTRTLIPLVHRRELPELLGRMLPEVPWPDGVLERPPARARRRYWTAPLLIAAVPAVAAAVVLPGALKLVAILPPVLAVTLGDSAWRGAGWILGRDVLAVRTQLIGRVTLLALARRAQRAVVVDQPFQRRVDLATFDVRLATGRTGRVRHLDAATADHLQRAVSAKTCRTPPPAVLRELSLFSTSPPE